MFIHVAWTFFLSPWLYRWLSLRLVIYVDFRSENMFCQWECFCSHVLKLKWTCFSSLLRTKCLFTCFKAEVDVFCITVAASVCLHVSKLKWMCFASLLQTVFVYMFQSWSGCVLHHCCSQCLFTCFKAEVDVFCITVADSVCLHVSKLKWTCFLSLLQTVFTWTCFSSLFFFLNVGLNKVFVYMFWSWSGPAFHHCCKVFVYMF